MIIKPPIRGQDDYGSGQYLAPRGNRKHNGVDYCCYPGSAVCSPVYGIVTKLGYAYGDDLSFRYIEVEMTNGHFARVFYISPTIAVGSKVNKKSVLGLSQTLQNRYPKNSKHENPITNHIHLEIFELVKGKKIYFNPLEYLKRASNGLV